MCDSVKSHHCLRTPMDGCPYNISIHISFPLPVLLTFSPYGAKILKETWGTNTLIPLYDNEDSVCGIIYNNKSYYFLKNLQGDIIEILDGDTGSTVVRYGYNAWGACNSVQDYSGCNLANINPFRYRGYYYDTEIQKYYLQSRYYDPFVGRFIIWIYTRLFNGNHL